MTLQDKLFVNGNARLFTIKSRCALRRFAVVARTIPGKGGAPRGFYERSDIVSADLHEIDKNIERLRGRRRSRRGGKEGTTADFTARWEHCLPIILGFSCDARAPTVTRFGRAYVRAQT